MSLSQLRGVSVQEVAGSLYSHAFMLSRWRKEARDRMKKYTSKALHPDASELNHEAYKRGCALFHDENYHKAKRAFEEALTYWPKDSQAWLALGNCEDELNNPKAAESCFRQALKYCENKNRDGVRFNLANSLLDQERHGEAIELYEQIPADSDVYAKAQRNLSIAKRSLQDSRKET